MESNTKARIIELKRKHSYKEVSQMLGIPINTIKTIVARSGKLRDNEAHRKYFSMPDPKDEYQPIENTAKLNGSTDIDLANYAIDLAAQGDIQAAQNALNRVQTPLTVLDEQHQETLRNLGAPAIALAMAKNQFSVIPARIEHYKIVNERNIDTLRRFGSIQAAAETDQDRFLKDIIGNIDPDDWHNDPLFDQVEDKAPQTIADIIHELEFWTDIQMRRRHLMIDQDEDHIDIRRSYLMRKIKQIKPRNPEESKMVLNSSVFKELTDEVDESNPHNLSKMIEHLLGL